MRTARSLLWEARRWQYLPAATSVFVTPTQAYAYGCGNKPWDCGFYFQAHTAGLTLPNSTQQLWTLYRFTGISTGLLSPWFLIYYDCLRWPRRHCTPQAPHIFDNCYYATTSFPLVPACRISRLHFYVLASIPCLLVLVISSCHCAVWKWVPLVSEDCIRHFFSFLSSRLISLKMFSNCCCVFCSLMLNLFRCVTIDDNESGPCHLGT